MAKRKLKQLYWPCTISTDIKPKQFGDKFRIEFYHAYVGKNKDPNKDVRWIKFYAWNDLARHIAERYRRGDDILIERAGPTEGYAKNPTTGAWDVPCVDWTIYALDEGWINNAPDSIPDATDSVEVGEYVIGDDDEIPF